MCFQEFVEQHRIHRVVAHRADSAMTVAGYQIRAYLFYFLGNESKSQGTRWFNLRLVTEAYRLEAVDYLAGLFHRLDLVLETSRGNHLAELAG